MTDVPHNLIAAAVLGLIAGTGCATPVAKPASTPQPTELVQCFESYETAFQYIAKCEDLPADRHTVFELAADSTIERWSFDQTGDLAVVRADYHGNSHFGIRGAQGQGRYYVFQTDEHRWRLVGVLHGNGYRWQHVDHQLQVVTWWHMSGSESPERVYRWNDGRFE